MIKINNNKGIIALATLLIVSMLLLSAGITLIYTSIDLDAQAKSVLNKSINELKIQAASEEAMLKIKSDILVIGEFTIDYEYGNCIINISNDLQADIKNVSITCQNEDYYNSITFQVDTSTEPISKI